jgi:hypothetical protein
MVLPIASGGQPMRRLALSLVLALALHGMALYGLHFSASSVPAGRQRVLKVVLLSAPAPSSANFDDARRGASISGTVAPSPRRAVPLQLPGMDEQPAPTPLQESQPMISAAQLLESARRIIREEAKSKPGQGVAKGSEYLVDDTVEAKMAKALRAPIAGEKWLGDGLVKITTTLGTSYCLKAPPDLLRGGPVDPISVPMTCP